MVCMNKVRYQHPQGHSTDDLNKWLARQLELNLLRIKKYGFAVKCEAITKQDQNNNAGYQCPRYSTHILDGRYICAVHNKPFNNERRDLSFPSRQGERYEHKNIFIEERKCPYQFMGDLIKDLCNIDEEFREHVVRAVTC